jgi:hypothetical protein
MFLIFCSIELTLSKKKDKKDETGEKGETDAKGEKGETVETNVDKKGNGHDEFSGP